MLEGVRRKAVTDAVNAIQGWIRTLNSDGELPAAFWQDPYVLGYLTSCIRCVAKLSTIGKIEGRELAQVVTDVFKELAGQDGVAISDSVIAFGKSKHPDFDLGWNNADKFMCVSFGIPGYENDPEVLKAARLAAAISPDLTSAVGPLTRRAETAAMLCKVLFYDPVRSRLGVGDE